MTWDINQPYMSESKKICWEVAPYLRGRGLDVGAGEFKVLPHAISVDNMHHTQYGLNIRPDIICDASKLDIFASCSMDFVYSSHVLEHVEDMGATLKEWWRLVKQGGVLVMYLPHKDFYPRVGQPGANPDHKRDFGPEDVIEAMPKGWDLIDCQERDGGIEYSFLLVFRKLNSGERRRSYQNPKPEKTACVVRYGAYGDVLQASSVFAGLKSEGYHVTVFAAPPGSDVILHDPNIDNLVLFDKDQVPNGNLGDFWAWQSQKFDKFVNLSESVEGTLLALPGRVQHGWSPLLRHQMMNKNYLQHQHDIAGVPHVPQVKFYATPEEKKWAEKTRGKMGPGPVVMWSLSGSSVHKTWAGLDNMLAGIMIEYPTAHVVLVGGPECVILEQGWENEPRVHKTSGQWSMRQTLSFIDQCDLIIGPETGVMNAASCLPVEKVVFLSHSSVENFTRDWVNTASIWSEKTSCRFRPEGVSACHMLHYGWTVCPKHDESGTAQCQADIDPAIVWNAIATVLSKHQRLQALTGT